MGAKVGKPSGLLPKAPAPTRTFLDAFGQPVARRVMLPAVGRALAVRTRGQAISC